MQRAQLPSNAKRRAGLSVIARFKYSRTIRIMRGLQDKSEWLSEMVMKPRGPKKKG